MQNSLFGLENRYASLSKTGDPLERLNAIIDWEIFRPILERLDAKEHNAGRKPTYRIFMFKMQSYFTVRHSQGGIGWASCQSPRREALAFFSASP